MYRSYQFVIAICLICYAQQTSSLKKFIPTVISRSTTSKNLECDGPKKSITNHVLVTTSGAISSMIALSMPLVANAAAGIPVGISNGVRRIPLDISSTDTIEKASNAITAAGSLLPDTSINSLDGGVNLGAILFTFVLYNGLFGKAGRPADWVLPVAAKAVGEEQSPWFKDFSDGFSFNVPPTVELIRFSFFAVLGWFTNLAWIAALDGDSFWGWSTAACLCFPSGLIALSRDPKPTREEFEFEETMKRNFSLFGPKFLSKEANSKCSEANIILRFRRSFVAYRTEEDVSDKDLKKVIRQWVGFKADAEGYYIGVSLLNKKRESRQALAKVMTRLDQEKAALLLEDEDDDDDYPRFDNEFVRK